MNTPEDLLRHLKVTYGIEQRWPNQFEVSAELYGRVCDALVKYIIAHHVYTMVPGRGYQIELSVGQHGGVLFKNVELIIKS